MKTPETYLGDGLYGSFDGYQIELRAPGISGDNAVYLEPKVVIELHNYMQTLIETYPSLAGRWGMKGKSDD